MKFLYFLNVMETKVECHAYKDKAALQPFRVPFTKARQLELKWNEGVVEIKSVLCIVVGWWMGWRCKDPETWGCCEVRFCRRWR